MEYNGNIEEELVITFEVGYQDIFGEKISHNLIERGSEVLVTQDNKRVSLKHKFVSSLNAKYFFFFLLSLSHIQILKKSVKLIVYSACKYRAFLCRILSTVMQTSF